MRDVYHALIVLCPWPEEVLGGAFDLELLWRFEGTTDTVTTALSLDPARPEPEEGTT